VVLIDTDTLASLPDRELASGIAEVVKYGLIRDAPFFEWLEANMERLVARDPEAIAYAVERSCVNKVRRGRAPPGRRCRAGGELPRRYLGLALAAGLGSGGGRGRGAAACDWSAALRTGQQRG
jgi:hypothetical protein